MPNCMDSLASDDWIRLLQTLNSLGMEIKWQDRTAGQVLLQVPEVRR